MIKKIYNSDGNRFNSITFKGNIDSGKQIPLHPALYRTQRSNSSFER
ncbi:MAG TPA: hypothetical protein V6D13_00380 [Halomicronema sp.]